MRNRVTEIAVNNAAIDKEWVIDGLARNIVDARADKQYGVVKSCYELIGKELNMFTREASVAELWDGDLTSLTDAQLDRMAKYCEQFLPPDRIEYYRQRCALEEGPVIDVEAIRMPEKQPACDARTEQAQGSEDAQGSVGPEDPEEDW